MSVKILIDSASDLNQKDAENLGINLMPIKVQFGDEEFLDGVNLLPETFYDKLTSSKDLPQTSLINEFQWDEIFNTLTANGDDVVVITLSSKISGTHSCAVSAAKKYEGKVFVVDSLNACLGERLLCEYAIKLRDQGLSASEIATELEAKKSKIKVFAVIDTLKYLKKGGRISATTAFVGEMLSIKPLVAVIDGEVKVIGKAHGLKKGFSFLNEKIEQTNGIDFDMPYGLLWSGNDDSNLKSFSDHSSKIWEDKTTKISAHKLGSTIGTHIGPGAIGISYFEK